MTSGSKFQDAQLWYRVFKYTVYCLLAYNIWLFFLDDFAASTQTFTDGVSWRNVVEAYSATFDTLAWVILLLLFELETAVISDERLGGSLKWMLSGLRVVCYLLIVYSFYGYVVKYGVVTDTVAFASKNVCDLVGTDFTYLDTLDEYYPLTAEVCVSMRGLSIQQIVGTKIIATPEKLALAKSLALTDIVNAADWLIVVAMLEAEVMLQLKGRLSDRLLRVNTYVKGLLYGVLFACAVYWGIDGDFLDFWDAFLWLVAFIFIEMNIFEWHAERAE